MTFFNKFWKKARVYYTLSISRGGPRPPGPPLDSPLYLIHNMGPFVRKFFRITYDGGLLQVKISFVYFFSFKPFFFFFFLNFPGGSDRPPLLPPAGAHAPIQNSGGVATPQPPPPCLAPLPFRRAPSDQFLRLLYGGLPGQFFRPIT